MLLHSGNTFTHRVGRIRPSSHDGKDEQTKRDRFKEVLKVLVSRQFPYLAVKKNIAVVKVLHVDVFASTGHGHDNIGQLFFRLRSQPRGGSSDRYGLEG